MSDSPNAKYKVWNFKAIEVYFYFHFHFLIMKHEESDSDREREMERAEKTNNMHPHDSLMISMIDFIVYKYQAFQMNN